MTHTCHLHRLTLEGFDALQLSNGPLSLTVIPALGGKISSILHLPSQREWLWRNPHLPYTAPQYAASYVERYDTGGLDECFPTVDPGPAPSEPWAGTLIPDHGELWGQPWECKIVEESQQRLSLRMTAYGVRFPYRFERTLTLEAGQSTLRLAYRLTNFAPLPMPFVWAIHPLLNIAPGMRLHLPVEQVRLSVVTNPALGQPGDLLPWPVAGTVDLSLIPPHSVGQAVKLYTLPLTGPGPVETGLSDPATGCGLFFRFDPAEITHIALWLNAGGWSPWADTPPYYNLGFEPGIGGADTLAEAVARNEVGLAPARQAKTWQLELKLR
jgi:hypothetical protein